MKNYMVLMLIFFAAALLLSACSGNAATVSPGPAPTLSAPPAVTPTAVKTTPTQMGYPAPSGGQPQAAYPAPSNGLQVAGPDGKLKPVAAAAIGGIARVNVAVNGQEMQLRKLADLLTLAGIASYKNVTVVGGNGKMALSGDQLAKAYLDVNDSGGINLVVDGVQSDRWISGVTQVNAE